MAVKRLEERLAEYNILENGWEIVYNEETPGGQGKVYPVKKIIGDEVLIEAIKVISIPSEKEEQEWKGKSQSDRESKVKERKKEYETLLKLRGNNHVMPVRDVVEKKFDLINEGDQLGCDIIIRMDYLMTLEDYLARNNYEPFEDKDVIKCGIQICSALECLHKNDIVHRDIKPSNIFIKQSLDSDKEFCLGDFGSVKESSMGLSMGKSESSIGGTWWYWPPYFIRSENPAEYRVEGELYALGLTLYCMATGGRLPYEEKTIKELTDREATIALFKRGEQEKIPIGNINGKIGSVIQKACSIKIIDRNNIQANGYKAAMLMRKDLEKINEPKRQNGENSIVKVENESTEKVVSNLELTVPEEKIKQRPVERIFTKRDYKGEQILVIDDEYTGIADYALQGTPIVELTVGASVKTFGRKIWANCRSLKKLNVENYEVVYEGDFDDCNRLEEVILPNCKNISENAFSNSYGKRSCQFLERIDAPKCKKIGENAFEGCIALEKIELLECIDIGKAAFRRCERITTVHMPKCERIGGNAFEECVCFRSIHMPQCKKVGADAFRGCNNLVEVNIPMCEEMGDKLTEANSSSSHKIKIWRPSNHNFRK